MIKSAKFVESALVGKHSFAQREFAKLMAEKVMARIDEVKGGLYKTPLKEMVTKYEVVSDHEDNEMASNSEKTFASKDEADKYAADLKAKGKKGVSVSSVQVKD